MPDVLDRVGMPAVGSGVERLDHVPAVRHDLSAGVVHRGHPSVAVGATLLVVADVDLIVRAVGDVAVALRAGRRAPHPRRRERSTGDGLSPERSGRPRARHLAQPVEVLLEVDRQHQPLVPRSCAPVELELQVAPVVEAPASATDARAPRPYVAIRSNDVPPQVWPPTREPSWFRTANPAAFARTVQVRPAGMRATVRPPGCRPRALPARPWRPRGPPSRPTRARRGSCQPDRRSGPRACLGRSA